MTQDEAIREIRYGIERATVGLRALTEWVEAPKAPDTPPLASTLQQRPLGPPPAALTAPPELAALPTHKKYTEDIFEDAYSINNVECVGKSKKHNGKPARLFRLPTGWTAQGDQDAKPTREFWVPVSQIAPTSDVFDVKDVGTLEMSQWMAEQKKILPPHVAR